MELTQFTTPWRQYFDKKSKTTYRLRATYGFDMRFAKETNQAPHFSVTADEQVLKKNNRWYDSGGGCMHDDVAKKFPKLAPLIRWHLTSYPGTPMHYVANGVYWLEQVVGASQWEKKSYDPDPLEAFRHTVAWGAVPGDTDEALESLIAGLTHGWESPEVKKIIRQDIKDRATKFLMARAEPLQQAFLRDMLAFGLIRHATPSPSSQIEQPVMPPAKFEIGQRVQLTKEAGDIFDSMTILVTDMISRQRSVDGVWEWAYLGTHTDGVYVSEEMLRLAD